MGGWVRKLRRWLQRLYDGSARRLEREIDEELSFHIEMRTREQLAAGRSPEEARRRAHVRFGNLDDVRRVAREIRGRRQRRRYRTLNVLAADLGQDLRFGVRALASSPATTAIALLVLALGIGASTTVFSIIDGMLLQELPYEDPDRLVFIGGRALSRDTKEPFREGLGALEGFAFFTIRAHEAVGPDGARVARSLPVDLEFLSILGVPPALGRTFVADDFRPDAPPTAILTDRLWRRSFGADPGAVGATIRLDGVPFMVVGIMRPGFTFLPYSWYDIFLPLPFADRQGGMAIGRLREGVGVEQVRSQAESLARSFDDGRSEAERTSISVRLLHEHVTGGYRTELLLIGGAVALVVLIACANVANLLLARGLARQGEISVRAALGASRGRLVRQLLTESGLLALCGGTLGVLAATWGVRAFLAFTPISFLGRLENVGIDGRVLAFALVTSLLTGVLCGLAPLLSVGSRDLKEAMVGGAERSSASRAGRRALNVLVVAEIAISLVLLIGTGLVVRAFLELRPNEPGFDPDRKLIFEVRPSERRYAEPASIARLYDLLLAELEGLPAVERAAAISAPPMVGMVTALRAVPEGWDPASENLPSLWYERTSHDYHDVMNIRIVRGRALAADGSSSLPEMVISEQAARGLFPDGEPLGKRITVKHREGDRDFGVVGVAADTRRMGLSTRPRPTVWVRYGDDPDSRMTFIVQARDRPELLAGPVRDLVARVDPELPIWDLQMMDQLLYESVATPRFYMTLMGAFGGSAILLALIGFWSVMSYAVGCRTHELGVRMVLGAAPRAIQWMVVRQGMAIVGVGVALGLAGSVALTRLLESLLFGLSPTDAATYAALVALVVAVGLAASFLPARRAARADPLMTLRSE